MITATAHSKIRGLYVGAPITGEAWPRPYILRLVMGWRPREILPS